MIWSSFNDQFNVLRSFIRNVIINGSKSWRFWNRLEFSKVAYINILEIKITTCRTISKIISDPGNVTYNFLQIKGCSKVIQLELIMGNFLHLIVLIFKLSTDMGVPRISTRRVLIEKYQMSVFVQYEIL